jgi:hypothetical protein
LVKKSARLPQGLKPKSKPTTYRSGEPLRHPKAEFFSKLLAGRFDPELLGVLGVQSLAAGELHGLGADDAADGSSAEKAI